MSLAAVEIKGEQQLQRIFKILPSKVNRKIQMKALRSGGKILVKGVRNNAPKRTKTLSKSVGMINDKNRLGAAVWVGIRIAKKFKFSGWYGWFVHEGTKGFGKRTRSKGTTIGYSRKGGGIQPNKFFEEAWNSLNDNVFNAIRENLSQEVVNYLRSNVPKLYR